ncbi:MAG: MarR family transcriptional regulator [Burkholderiales bacterium]|nr:MarR family transcriptional regulator [Burkholderiales bacterium]
MSTHPPRRPPDPADFYKPDGYCSNESIGFLMRRIMQSLVTHVDRRLEVHDLTHAQWGPLFLLLQGRATTLAELSRDLQIDAGALTRTLDRLEAKGLCRRERSTEDRRVVHLVLTEEGRAASSQVPKVLCEALNAYLAGFTHDEWQTLMSLLQRVAHNAEVIREAEAHVRDHSLHASDPDQV